MLRLRLGGLHGGHGGGGAAGPSILARSSALRAPFRVGLGLPLLSKPTAIHPSLSAPKRNFWFLRPYDGHLRNGWLKTQWEGPISYGSRSIGEDFDKQLLHYEPNRPLLEQGVHWRAFYQSLPWPFNRIWDAREKWRGFGSTFAGRRVASFFSRLDQYRRVKYLLFALLLIWLLFYKRPWDAYKEEEEAQPLPHAKTITNSVKLFMQYFRLPQPELLTQAMPHMIGPDFHRRVKMFLVMREKNWFTGGDANDFYLPVLGFLLEAFKQSPDKGEGWWIWLARDHLDDPVFREARSRMLIMLMYHSEIPQKEGILSEMILRTLPPGTPKEEQERLLKGTTDDLESMLDNMGKAELSLGKFFFTGELKHLIDMFSFYTEEYYELEKLPRWKFSVERQIFLQKFKHNIYYLLRIPHLNTLVERASRWADIELTGWVQGFLNHLGPKGIKFNLYTYFSKKPEEEMLEGYRQGAHHAVYEYDLEKESREHLAGWHKYRKHVFPPDEMLLPAERGTIPIPPPPPPLMPEIAPYVQLLPDGYMPSFTPSNLSDMVNPGHEYDITRLEKRRQLVEEARKKGTLEKFITPELEEFKPVDVEGWNPHPDPVAQKLLLDPLRRKLDKEEREKPVPVPRARKAPEGLKDYDMRGTVKE